MSDGNQEITDVVVTGNATASGVYKDGAFGNAALYAEWKNTKGCGLGEVDTLVRTIRGET